MRAKSQKKKPSVAKRTGSGKAPAKPAKPGDKKARKRTRTSGGDEGPPINT
jgi:hypothetical protein